VSVPIGDVQATFAAVLVDEWIRAGVGHAVVCPGSRSTPLVVALAERDEITLHVRLDERGACFYAIGLSLATADPAIVCTTSGTAAAELHAGVVEASHAGVPMIVCTADRPARLHGVGAPQTIEQAHLFGRTVRWFVEPGLPNDDERDSWRALGARAVAEARAGAGPVHLNLAFDEPLLGTAGPLPERRDGAPRHAGPPPPLIPRPAGGDARWQRPGIIVAGGGGPAPEGILAAADRLGWPVLADPRSGLRSDHPAVVGAADAILRDPEVRGALVPETILTVGGPWASRVLAEFIEAAGGSGTEILAVNPAPSIDPSRVAYPVLRGDPTDLLASLGDIGVAAPSQWRARWERLEAAAQRAIDKTLDDDPLASGGRTTEPGTLRRLFADLAPTTTLFVSSSMPVRDLEWFGAPRPSPPRVVSNRGANGIDGVVSTALGVAAGQDEPVVGVLGDLAFLHDSSALARLGDERRGSCTLVVIDNGGGGIFNFLPQATVLDRPRFERLFATAPAVSIAEVAWGFGLSVADVSTMAALDEALARFVGHEHLSVVRVEMPPRDENVALHDRIHRAVTAAARAELAG
jgi:2-succinyl-5-enolpyruvyl-6-hydroxy-3-cyclohexene-1-carboxylate synthase